MMKHIVLIVIALFAICGITGAQDSSAQLFNAVNALKQQQAELADNQTKLDQKIADVGETIRVARLFMSRAGGKHKPPSLTNPPTNKPPPTSKPPGSK